MNMWHELRSRIELNRRASYGDPPIFNLITEIMDDIEKKYWHDATNEFILKHRYMIERDCQKEPTDAAYVVKQVAALTASLLLLKQNIIQLDARLDNHVDDRDRHLRQPGKYTAHNLFM